MSEEYEFEDYFSDDGDPGLLIEIEWDGRKVPFRVKRHLNLGDKQRIRAAGVKVGIGADGKAEIIGDVDEVAFAHTIVLTGVKHWPFTKDGKPVPITPETVAQLDGGLLDALAARTIVATKYAMESLDPFVLPSAKVSSSAAPAKKK